jgi:hypothetical protein
MKKGVITIFGSSSGCICGNSYPYGVVGLPSIIISYNIYHKYNNTDDKIKTASLFWLIYI